MVGFHQNNLTNRLIVNKYHCHLNPPSGKLVVICPNCYNSSTIQYLRLDIYINLTRHWVYSEGLVRLEIRQLVFKVYWGFASQWEHFCHSKSTRKNIHLNWGNIILSLTQHSKTLVKIIIYYSNLKLIVSLNHIKSARQAILQF